MKENKENSSRSFKERYFKNTSITPSTSLNRFIYSNNDNHTRAINEDDYKTNIDELNEKIRESNDSYNTIQREIKKLKRDTKKQFKDEMGEIRNKIEQDKNRVVETIGVFAALFTFLSLQVQIMKEEREPIAIIALVLVTGGIITFFVLILDLLVRSRDEVGGIFLLRFCLLLAMSSLMLICGVLMFTL